MGHLRGSSPVYLGYVRSPRDRHKFFTLSFCLRTLQCRGITQRPTMAQGLICPQRELLELPVCQGTPSTHVF